MDADDFGVDGGILTSTSSGPYQQQQQQPLLNDELVAESGGGESVVELYAVVCLLLTFFVVGSAGNAIVLWVFCRRRDQLVSTVFIVVLAAVDFITSLVVVPLTVVFEMVGFRVGSDLVCKFYQFLITCNIPYSAFIMVAIAVDRYLCICHPFVHALTVRRAWITSGLLGICASAIGVCVALMYSVGGRPIGASSSSSSPELVRRGPGDNITVETTTTTSTTMTASTLWPHSSIGSRFDSDLRQPPCTDGRDFGAAVDPDSNASGLDAAAVNCRNSSSARWIGFDAAADGDDARLTLSSSAAVAEPGLCHPTDELLSADFLWYFQKFYNGMFLVCLVVIVFLYALIYRSVVDRRTRRQRQKSNSLAFVTSTIRVVDGRPLEVFRSAAGCGGAPVSMSVYAADDEPTGVDESRRRESLAAPSSTGVENGSRKQRQRLSVVDFRMAVRAIGKRRESGIEDDGGGGRKRSRADRRSTVLATSSALPASIRERQRNRVASLKTAAMLFVVTVVFVATFLPAFLMTVHVVPYRMFVFYMYFANNVANPFIYSFMNQNFRENMQRLFCRHWHRAASK